VEVSRKVFEVEEVGVAVFGVPDVAAAVVVDRPSRDDEGQLSMALNTGLTQRKAAVKPLDL
jgi:hypothetical protein